MEQNIEKIIHSDALLCIIIRSSYKVDGVSFLTPDDFTQQLGYMNHPKDHVILPHTHNVVKREIVHTQEVLFIKTGKVRVDFYDDKQRYLESRILASGDVVLLAHGGHGFKMLEPSEIIEVKQGPYCGEMDKVRFEPIQDNKIILK
jgi:hypothetical protein